MSQFSIRKIDDVRLCGYLPSVAKLGTYCAAKKIEHGGCRPESAKM